MFYISFLSQTVVISVEVVHVIVIVEIVAIVVVIHVIIVVRIIVIVVSVGRDGRLAVGAGLGVAVGSVVFVSAGADTCSVSAVCPGVQGKFP